MITGAQNLLDQVKADLNLTQGEVIMWIPDMPNIPPQDIPVMIAQANQAQAGGKTKARALGVCRPVPSNYYGGENTLSPIFPAEDYFTLYEPKTTFTGPATVTVLQQPKHGVLRLMTEADRGVFFSDTSGPIDPNDPGYIYLPEKDYLGDDKASFLIERGGITIKVVYFFKAVQGPLGNSGGEEHCYKTGIRWKISSTLDANGNSTITAINYLSPIAATSTSVTDANALSSWLTLAQLDGKVADISGINITFADLPGSAVGQTVGSNITLDTSAAGHGWYVDANPWDNSEYLATSNPYEWVARAGSAAEGKMDLLSVLLHEYGHALGIEHSMDSHNYMGTTLTPGVRRMPSAEELALMQRLVGQVKEGMVADSTLSPTLPLQGGGEPGVPNPAWPLSGGFLAFLGRRKESGFGIQDVFNPQPPAIRPQYAVAANAAFTGLDSPTGWNTLGSVGITNNAATLNEVSTTHTRLSQVFTVNAKDRYLTFTLSGAALDDLTGAPDDAFEAALLDANTGASLLGGIGLTRSDAFFNLQADGMQNLANCVTCSDNPDGSRTYRVDLSGITAGTVANPGASDRAPHEPRYG